MTERTRLLALILATSFFVVGTASQKEAEMKKLGFVGGIPYSSGPGERSGKAMSLWLSPDFKTQPQASQTCKNLGGNLISILTKGQDEDVRMLLYAEDRLNSYWTSGVWNGAKQTWKWLSYDIDIGFYSNINDLCNRGSGFGITTRFNIDEYKWCTALEGTYLKYICQV